jgi:hypothetical protein
MAIEEMNKVSAKRAEIKKAAAMKRNSEKLVEINEKFAAEPEKMIEEIQKYNADRYDHANDPDGKYVPTDYSTMANLELYEASVKIQKYLDDIDYSSKDSWGDIYYERNTISDTLSSMRYNYKDLRTAEERVLKPMGISFDTATNPINEFDNKLKVLVDRLNAIEDGRQEKIERYRKEYQLSLKTIKTVDDRIAEFSAANIDLIPPQLVYTNTEPVVEDIPHEEVKPVENIPQLPAPEVKSEVKSEVKPFVPVVEEIPQTILPADEPAVKPFVQKPKKGDTVFDNKKKEKALVKNVFKPAKGSALENEPFLMDIKYENGNSAINMPMGDRFIVLSDSEGIPETIPADEPANLVKPVFGFMSNSPMHQGKALAVLEKKIRDENSKVLPIYQWIEEMPAGLEVDTVKINSYKNDKGYTDKMVIGNHIVNTKAEQEYYKYLHTGGESYSAYLEKKKAYDAVIAAEKAAERKIADDKRAIQQKEAEKNSKIIKDALIKSLILDGKQGLIDKHTKQFRHEIEKLKAGRQTVQNQQSIDRNQMYIDQAVRQADGMFEIATKLYKLVADGNVQKKYDWKVGDNVLYALNASESKFIETKINTIRENADGSLTYKVDPAEGIFNEYVGYDGLFPVVEEKTKEPEEDLQTTIKNQIEVLTLAKEFADADEQENIDNQIEALNISLNFV